MISNSSLVSFILSSVVILVRLGLANETSTESGLRSFTTSPISLNSLNNLIGKPIITTPNPMQQFQAQCTTTTNVQGTCLRRSECIRNNGVAAGFCGTFGVCCEMNLACEGISRLKRTVIRNPSPLPTRCTYHFQPYSQNVCQLRIDFDMTLAQPTVPQITNNAIFVSCELDVFQAGSIRICGSNTNQHIYVPFDVASGISDVTLTFQLASRATNAIPPAFWNMIVTQIECPAPPKRLNTPADLFQPFNLRELRSFHRNNVDVDLIAPPGCLQYFYERTGTFQSFNYNGGQGPYIANMRYGICFRRTPSDTAVQFIASTFEIGAADTVNGFTDEDCHDVLGTVGRSNDYLLVPESRLETVPIFYGTHYCGRSLQNNMVLIHSPPGPFAIYFNSDNLFTTLVPERAFNIAYTII